MTKFHLEILLHIIGIGSASGLIFRNDSLYLISDSSGYLFEYNLRTQSFEKTPVLENHDAGNIPKKLKPDFEAIANHGDDFYLFGSGSTENRNKMVQYNAKSKSIKTIDLSSLYGLMQNFSNIKPEDFNIEGATFDGETWYFLQRGNGKSGTNGLFTVRGKNLADEFTILFNAYKLPKIKGVSCSFTDAVVANGKLYFLAAAEDSKSVYEDGVVLGSVVGTINLQTMKIESTQQISDSHKFEGITLHSETDTQLEFYLCEDNDSEALESDIYKLTVPKK